MAGTIARSGLSPPKGRSLRGKTSVRASFRGTISARADFAAGSSNDVAARPLPERPVEQARHAIPLRDPPLRDESPFYGPVEHPLSQHRLRKQRIYTWQGSTSKLAHLLPSVESPHFQNGTFSRNTGKTPKVPPFTAGPSTPIGLLLQDVDCVKISLAHDRRLQSIRM